jgi:hypothetical protein
MVAIGATGQQAPSVVTITVTEDMILRVRMWRDDDGSTACQLDDEQPNALMVLIPIDGMIGSHDAHAGEAVEEGSEPADTPASAGRMEEPLLPADRDRLERPASSGVVLACGAGLAAMLALTWCAAGPAGVLITLGAALLACCLGGSVIAEAGRRLGIVEARQS